MQIASRLLGLWLLGITLGVAHADVADDGGGGSTDGTGDDGTAGDDGSPGDDGSGGDTAASADDDGGCGSKDDAAYHVRGDCTPRTWGRLSVEHGTSRYGEATNVLATD